MLPGGICLLAGLSAGLLLIADPAPADPARLPDVHGVVMVLGFLGTLISLERAVALRQPRAYVEPAALGLGGIALAAPPVPLVVGRSLLMVGCAVAVATLVALSGRQHDDPTATQILGAAMAFGAAALWTKLDVADLLPWLVSYIVVTIAAERVELARLTMPLWSGRVLLLTSAALLFAATTALLKPDAGAHVFGALLVVLVTGLARIEVARQTIRSTGLPRYSAAALLLGYVWLAVAGVTLLVGGSPSSPERYDTVVQATARRRDLDGHGARTRHLSRRPAAAVALSHGDVGTTGSAPGRPRLSHPAGQRLWPATPLGARRHPERRRTPALRRDDRMEVWSPPDVHGPPRPHLTAWSRRPYDRS